MNTIDEINKIFIHALPIILHRALAFGSVFVLPVGVFGIRELFGVNIQILRRLRICLFVLDDISVQALSKLFVTCLFSSLGIKLFGFAYSRELGTRFGISDRGKFFLEPLDPLDDLSKIKKIAVRFCFVLLSFIYMLAIFHQT